MVKGKRKHSERGSGAAVMNVMFRFMMPPAAVGVMLGVEYLAGWLLLGRLSPYLLSDACRDYVYCTQHMTMSDFAVQAAVECPATIILLSTAVVGGVFVLASWLQGEVRSR